MPGPFTVAPGVYVPQHDSHLLCEVLAHTGIAHRRRVADLCTGSGLLAIEAARRGATSVTALDICSRAVRCARANALAAGVRVHVHHGSWYRAREFGPFELVVCNPPYVPVDGSEAIPAHAGPPWAWNGGQDGRRVLDPLCATAPALLGRGGTMLLVQSEFAGVEPSLRVLRDGGLTARVVATKRIPFGPVLSARARWLETTGRLRDGRRTEELVVIRADKP